VGFYEKDLPMKIAYLNGNRLYYAFLAGGNAVINDQKYLDKINVFPVPDGDTGTNLASTFRSIAAAAVPSPSIKETLRSIEKAAISGARGNSGIILAQFLHGISREIRTEMKISTQSFGESVKKAVQHAYSAIVSPVEGTMLTVIKDWAEDIYRNRTKTSDFVELLSRSLQTARVSLKETPKKLSVLARAGVVDAGAKGFVDFLEGIVEFIRRGKIETILVSKEQPEDRSFHIHTPRASYGQRFCTEALLSGKNLDLDRLKALIAPYGESAIVAGTESLARLHVHTNNPSDLFIELKEYGDTLQVKVDDMKKQYELSHKRKSDIALVVDSTCDLPAELSDRYQISSLPYVISFGQNLFLDKVTIKPSQFYRMLEASRQQPTTSVPGINIPQILFSFLLSHFESVICICLSDKFSASLQLCQNAAQSVEKNRISVVDSRHISASEGLIAVRAGEAIQEGKSRAEVLELIQSWIPKTKIFVDIHTLKYMVRSGRVSPLKGFLAKILNLKPIITIDSEGRAASFGKSFSRNRNMKKIVQLIRDFSEKDSIWNYAIVHVKCLARAQIYAEKLTGILKKEPLYIEDVSPAIGVHTGIGALGVAVMFD
jgi:DegV family protein with EDD domain